MWKRLPVWIRAVLTGFAVSAAPTLVWALLATVNLKLTPRLPWSAPVMALVLWGYWRFVRGDGPPRRLSAERRESLRAAPLPARVWDLALIFGGSAVAAVWASLAALRGMLHLVPAQGDVTRFPLWTVAASILMGSAVAAIAEEAGFRGYMQVPLEKAYGPLSAIATTSVIFTLVHLTHGAAILPYLPFYLVAAVVYGVLAHLTGSIFPSMALHFAGDVLMFTMMYLTVRLGAPGAAPPAAAVSPGFAVLSVAFAILGVMTCGLLAREVRLNTAAA